MELEDLATPHYEQEEALRPPLNYQIFNAAVFNLEIGYYIEVEAVRVPGLEAIAEAVLVVSELLKALTQGVDGQLGSSNYPKQVQILNIKQRGLLETRQPEQLELIISQIKCFLYTDSICYFQKLEVRGAVNQHQHNRVSLK